MIKVENEKLFNLYTLTEMAYEKHFLDNGFNVEEMYPHNWYSNNNYQEKIEIMVLAIKNNVLIEKILKSNKIRAKNSDNKG